MNGPNNNIGWCDYTWNPITGCKNGCGYCYGRRIRKRFHPDVPWDDIMYFDERLNEPAKVKKPSKIFVCSMSDLFGEWISGVFRGYIFDTIQKCPRHTFQILTKQPGNISRLMPDNVWLGITQTGRYNFFTNIGLLLVVFARLKFISFEPLMEDVSEQFERLRDEEKRRINWLILGAMTGPGSKDYRPSQRWISDILKEADRYKIPVFMKRNLKKAWKGGLRQEFPKGGD